MEMRHYCMLLPMIIDFTRTTDSNIGAFHTLLLMGVCLFQSLMGVCLFQSLKYHITVFDIFGSLCIQSDISNVLRRIREVISLSRLKLSLYLTDKTDDDELNTDEMDSDGTLDRVPAINLTNFRTFHMLV